MCSIQMMIVTGGYDGSQDVASTEVINFSGENLKKGFSPAKTWCGGKLGSFHRPEVDLVEPMWPESFTWLEVKTQDIPITIPPPVSCYSQFNGIRYGRKL